MTVMRTPAALAGAALLAAAVAAPAAAQSVEDFFKGKTIQISVGAGVGGGFDTAARVLANTMQRHIPGNPNIIVEAMPGAGGARSMNFMANVAPKDGTAMGAVLPPAIAAPRLQKELTYDSSEFIWLGSITPMPSVTSLWHTAPVQSLEEAKERETIMGTSSKVSVAYLVPALLNHLIGTRFTIIRGYAGGPPMNMAMEQEEIHGRVNYWNSYLVTNPDWIRDNKVIHIVQQGPGIDALPEVPHLRDFARTEEERQMVLIVETGDQVGHGFYLPPGVPEDRAAALRDAFDATVNDPKFRQEAEARNMVVDPVSAADVQRIVEEVFRIPDDVVAKFRDAVRLDED